VTSSAYYNAAENIFYNILGGLLTVPFAVGLGKLWSVYRNHRFKKVFGPGKKQFKLIFGTLVVNPALEKAMQIASGTPRPFPLVKKSVPGQTHSSSFLACGCEMRGMAYVAATLASVGGIFAHALSDEDVKGIFDIDFISFGATNNFKTMDLFNNRGNAYASFDLKQMAFVHRRTGEILKADSQDRDFGVIVRIHPEESPERTWICCAGMGEWGTSGTAWYLANRWKELGEFVDTNECFAAVIEVVPGQDESARLTRLIRSSDVIDVN
jgi:hypothetical protein